MSEQQQSLTAIRDIRQMMERSSRFISLSGLSGISAGVCALVGAWFALPYMQGEKEHFIDPERAATPGNSYTLLSNSYLFWIAALTFTAALLTAFIFTYIKSKKEGTPIWGTSARRLIMSIAVPLVVGGIFLVNLVHAGSFGLVAPGCLLFYGLALINASKYTFVEIKYLGYCEIILGVISLSFIGYGLYFWAAGFGLLHIIYGSYMWWKYDRTGQDSQK